MRTASDLEYNALIHLLSKDFSCPQVFESKPAMKLPQKVWDISSPESCRHHQQSYSTLSILKKRGENWTKNSIFKTDSKSFLKYDRAKGVEIILFCKFGQGVEIFQTSRQFEIG